MVIGNTTAPQAAYWNSTSSSGGSLVQPSPVEMPPFQALSGLFSPTGGVWVSFYSAETGGYIIATRLVASDARPTGAPTVAKVEDTICDTFNLTMSDLAAICGKTRKTLYDWRKGSVPRDEAGRHLYALYRAAQNWVAAGNPTPQKPQLTEQPLISGRTLYQMLSTQPIDPDEIRFAGSRLAMLSLPEEPLEDPFA